jgi:hypothetical protein
MPDAPEVHVPDWVQVNLVGKLHGQTTIYTHLYNLWSVSVPEVTITLEDIATEFLNQFWTGPDQYYKKVHSHHFACQMVTAQVIHPTRSIAWPAVPPGGMGNGLVVDNSLPSGVSVVIRRRGNIGDRHNYGRIYLAGVPQLWVTSSQISPDKRVEFTPIVDFMPFEVDVPAAGGTGKLRPYILNKSAVNGSRAVTHGMLDINLRYQRRREVGVGI